MGAYIYWQEGNLGEDVGPNNNSISFSSPRGIPNHALISRASAEERGYRHSIRLNPDRGIVHAPCRGANPGRIVAAIVSQA